MLAHRGSLALVQDSHNRHTHTQTKRLTMDRCIRISLLAILLNIGLTLACDQEAAQACAQEFSNSMVAMAQDPSAIQQFCANKEDSLSTSMLCFTNALEGCDEDMTTMYMAQFSAMQQQVNAACAGAGAQGACNAQTGQVCMAEIQNRLENIGSDIVQMQALCDSKEEMFASVVECLNEHGCDNTMKDAMMATLETMMGQTCEMFNSSAKSENCVMMFMGQCASGFPGLGEMSNLFNTDEAEMSHDQEETCNALKEVNYANLKECAENIGCAEESLLGGIEASPEDSNMPVITISDYVDLIEQICKPECKMFRENYNAAQQCPEITGMEVNCDEAQSHFDCISDHIGECSALADFMQRFIDQYQVLDKIRDNCPGINLNLKSEKESGATSLVLCPALLFPAFLSLFRTT